MIILPEGCTTAVGILPDGTIICEDFDFSQPFGIPSVDAGLPGYGGVGNTTLPNTGSPSLVLVLIASVLVGSGFGLRRLSRKGLLSVGLSGKVTV